MEKKKISMSTQLFLDAIPMVTTLIIFVVSKYNFTALNSDLICNFCNIILGLLVLSAFIKRDTEDEFAKKNLAISDKICINVTKIFILILIVLLGGPNFRNMDMNRNIVGIILCSFLAGITILRATIFYHYDRRGI
ncbi:hypothetical protein [Clostridium sp.]|uniref:hypothetical protein n=1 Tax=Clostridium sp. TaxID=1506 RepID=UPI003216ECCC